MGGLIDYLQVRYDKTGMNHDTLHTSQKDVVIALQWKITHYEYNHRLETDTNENVLVVIKQRYNHCAKYALFSQKTGYENPVDSAIAYAKKHAVDGLDWGIIRLKNGEIIQRNSEY